jgi:hypothetical protein
VFVNDTEAAYVYLLGLYLGDGYLGRQNQLRITLDVAYPEIVDAAAAAMAQVVAHGRAHIRRSESVQIVEASWIGWPELFPQHGPGRKHSRPIRLAAWQEGLVTAYTGEFVMGLLDSDGCRCVNRFTTRLPSGRVAEYAYVRYFFSNLSADIRRLFCDACDQLGIRWTQSNHRNISISNRRSVQVLDQIVGPKA